MQEEAGSTTPLESQTIDFEPCVQPHHIRSIMANVLIAFGTVLQTERSRPIDPELIKAVRLWKEEQEEVADFFEPVTFNWDEDVYIALEAARKFSEQIHADY